MRKSLSKILVTGGAGFIGSEFVRQSVTRGLKIVVLDKLTYAGDLKRLQGLSPKGTDPDFKFYKTDICNKKQIEAIFKKERPAFVVNFAAETHVDRSIKDASAFIKTNIEGVGVLLEACRKYKIKKFIQISTDEVYGDIKKGKFREDSPLNPSSPYAASKAAADLLIRSYIRTYNFPAAIVRPCNNYGPWQYPEKLIPVIIYNALRNKNVPIYAEGLNRREWLYVSDCAGAILLALEKAKPGEIYNIGSGHEEKNIDIAKKILAILGKPYSLIKFVPDRPGHDFRYSLDSSKIKKLGWKPKLSFEIGIKKTVDWNKKNLSWLEVRIPRASKRVRVK